MKILIVDNDMSVGTTVKAALGLNPSYEVDLSLGAKEGIEKMKENEYSLLLVDFMMPEVSGVDLCKIMADDEKMKNIPVVLISALPISSTAFQEANDNFQNISVIKGLLEKPFSVTDLLKKVEDLLPTNK